MVKSGKWAAWAFVAAFALSAAFTALNGAFCGFGGTAVAAYDGYEDVAVAAPVRLIANGSNADAVKPIGGTADLNADLIEGFEADAIGQTVTNSGDPVTNVSAVKNGSGANMSPYTNFSKNEDFNYDHTSVSFSFTLENAVNPSVLQYNFKFGMRTLQGVHGNKDNMWGAGLVVRFTQGNGNPYIAVDTATESGSGNVAGGNNNNYARAWRMAAADMDKKYTVTVLQSGGEVAVNAETGGAYLKPGAAAGTAANAEEGKIVVSDTEILGGGGYYFGFQQCKGKIEDVAFGGGASYTAKKCVEKDIPVPQPENGYAFAPLTVQQLNGAGAVLAENASFSGARVSDALTYGHTYIEAKYTGVKGTATAAHYLFNMGARLSRTDALLGTSVTNLDGVAVTVCPDRIEFYILKDGEGVVGGVKKVIAAPGKEGDIFHPIAEFTDNTEYTMILYFDTDGDKDRVTVTLNGVKLFEESVAAGTVPAEGGYRFQSNTAQSVNLTVSNIIAAGGTETQSEDPGDPYDPVELQERSAPVKPVPDGGQRFESLNKYSGAYSLGYTSYPEGAEFIIDTSGVADDNRLPVSGSGITAGYSLTSVTEPGGNVFKTDCGYTYFGIKYKIENYTGGASQSTGTQMVFGFRTDREARPANTAVTGIFIEIRNDSVVLTVKDAGDAVYTAAVYANPAGIAEATGTDAGDYHSSVALDGAERELIVSVNDTDKILYVCNGAATLFELDFTDYNVRAAGGLVFYNANWNKVTVTDLELLGGAQEVASSKTEAGPAPSVEKPAAPEGKAFAPLSIGATAASAIVYPGPRDVFSISSAATDKAYTATAYKGNTIDMGLDYTYYSFDYYIANYDTGNAARRYAIFGFRLGADLPSWNAAHNGLFVEIWAHSITAILADGSGADLYTGTVVDSPALGDYWHSGVALDGEGHRLTVAVEEEHVLIIRDDILLFEIPLGGNVQLHEQGGTYFYCNNDTLSVTGIEFLGGSLYDQSSETEPDDPAGTGAGGSESGTIPAREWPKAFPTAAVAAGSIAGALLIAGGITAFLRLRKRKAA
ncbi:MAG: hypothetical protein LBL66_08775 [Clostridiales bacterium]|jgi:hypothetical protein|nr:hypothetical protein [Clostridiales bacterium]